jgi:hypothetical protein
VKCSVCGCDLKTVTVANNAIEWLAIEPCKHCSASMEEGLQLTRRVSYLFGVVQSLREQLAICRIPEELAVLQLVNWTGNADCWEWKKKWNAETKRLLSGDAAEGKP